MTREERHTHCHSGAVRPAQALTFPPVCCFAVGAGGLDGPAPDLPLEPPLLHTGTRAIYTAGRPPWYEEHGVQPTEAFVIGTMMFLYIFQTVTLRL